MVSCSIGASTSAKEIPGPRPLRIEYAGALYHITLRGNERRAIYRRGEDRIRFLKNLFSVCDRYEWLCHAYCLMGNYYHLLIETQAPNLSQGMRKFNGDDSQCFNHSHR
ncbi:transposase [Congregibacter sp.]|jgi:putative transposase|uniref:transposase n=1 Tax=Congregibacter sp. TaxID=2744308 RepID=UPI0039E44A10